jgi:hypothetical protein
MNNGLLVLAVVLVVAMILVIGMKPARRSSYEYRRNRLLTEAEAHFLRILMKEFPGFLFFPQVGMAALLVPACDRKAAGYMPAFRSVSQKRVDFVVCDSRNFEVVCLLELDDSSHDTVKDRVRDRATGSAGYRTVRVRGGRNLDISSLRQLLNSH